MLWNCALMDRVVSGVRIADLMLDGGVNGWSEVGVGVEALSFEKWKVEWDTQTGVCRWSTSTFEKVYCPGHGGVKGSDLADRLAGKATLTSGLLLGRSEVLRSLRHYLRAQSQGHHTTDRLEERGVERGSVRRSSLRGRERAIVSQTNIGTISKATLGTLLKDGVEHVWAFPSA